MDGEVLSWQTVRVTAGARLRVRGTSRGARSYLAIAGGLDVRTVLGSASTDVRGLVGRALRAGDVPGRGSGAMPAARLHARPAAHDPARPIRLLPGPQHDAAAVAALCAGAFRSASATASACAWTGRPFPAARSCPSRRRWARSR